MALLRESPSGPEVVVAAGEEISLEVLSAGAAIGNEPGISFREVDGSVVAWRPPASAGGLSALVVLPRGMEFVDWKKELLEFSLEHLTDPGRALGRELASTAASEAPARLPRRDGPGSVSGHAEPPVADREDGPLAHRHPRPRGDGNGQGADREDDPRLGPDAGRAVRGDQLRGDPVGAPRVGAVRRPRTGRHGSRPPGGTDPRGARRGPFSSTRSASCPLSLQPKLLRFLQEREVHSVEPRGRRR